MLIDALLNEGTKKAPPCGGASGVNQRFRDCLGDNPIRDFLVEESNGLSRVQCKDSGLEHGPVFVFVGDDVVHPPAANVQSKMTDMSIAGESSSISRLRSSTVITSR